MQLHTPPGRCFWPAIALLSSLLLVACGSDIEVNPLAPDTSYAAQGKATVPIGTVDGRIGKSALQADGKLLVAGWRQAPASEPGHAPAEVFVIRINGDGSPDTAFGVGGEVRLTVQGSDTVADLAVQADGRILLAVNAGEPCVVTGFFLCTTAGGRAATRASVILRLTPEGLRDSSFGVGGSVEAPASTNRLTLALQNDGRILLLRSTGSSRARVFGWALTRYQPDGMPDATFNQGQAVASTCQVDDAALLLQPDAGIVVGGVQGVWYADPAANPGLCLERLHADASRDPGFANLNPTVSFNTNMTLLPLSALPDNGFSAVGRSSDISSAGFWVSQFDREGNMDPTFAQDGAVQSLLDPTFTLAGAQRTRAGELMLLGTQQPNPAEQMPTTYQRVWIKLDAIGQAVPGWGVSGVLVQAPEPQQAQQLLQDTQGRWLVVSRARMADGGLAVVVSRLRGDSQ